MREELAELIDEFWNSDAHLVEILTEIGIQYGHISRLRLAVPHLARQAVALLLSLFRPTYVVTYNPTKVGDILDIKKVGLVDSKDELRIKIGESYSLTLLASILAARGFTRVANVMSEQQFAIRGGILDIMSNGDKFGVRLDFFGDTLDTIQEFSPQNQRVVWTGEDFANGVIIPNTQENISVGDFEKNAIVIINEPEIMLTNALDEYEDLQKMLQDQEITSVSMTQIGTPTFKIEVNDSQKEILRNINDLLTVNLPKHNTRSKRNKKPKIDMEKLEIGDYLVHDKHGIGKLLEMKDGYFIIEYAPNKRGHKHDIFELPFEFSYELSPYIGVAKPPLSKFGGADFSRAKRRAKNFAKQISDQLITIYKARLESKGFGFDTDIVQMNSLADQFKFNLTPDQETAIRDVLNDMAKPTPMDRLICGDVGFGKTEIAIRAAFTAILNGKQVAVLVPTTLLASQHFDTFKARLEEFGVSVAMVSRFVKPQARAAILSDLEKGKVDIIIGTHTLLSKKIKFADLGLMVVDEEQRFGALHKELLKAMRPNVDVLTMSATPIPRTLEMALTGLRDISMLETPPENRQPIDTIVERYSDATVRKAIVAELHRGGQVFYLHNHVDSIEHAAKKLADLVPDARIAIAHGKMNRGSIDRIVQRFWEKEFDILVCTTIVETGLDIANANTLIVENADRLGLTQLHQLRGRVGRSSRQAVAYFLYNKAGTLTETAVTRLETIVDLNELGAGTAIALKDLEMRGAGNMLGAEQSGQIAGVGFDMYVRIMSDVVEEAKFSVFA